MAEEKKPKVTYSQTVCQKRPEMCEPRRIEMVCWDADDTMWEIRPYGIASSVRGPFKKIDDDTLEAGHGTYYGEPSPPKKPKEPEKPPAATHPLRFTPSYLLEEEDEELAEIYEELSGELSGENKRLLEIASETTGQQMKLIPMATGEKRKQWWEREPPPPEPPPVKKTYKSERITVKLLPTFRDTLSELEKRGIQSSIISLNTPGSVKDIIAAFGMTDRFVDIEDTWKNKGQVFRELTQKNKICPCNAMFVDNTLGHVNDVSKECGLALQIGKGKDVEVPIEILNFIEEKYG